MTPEQEKAVRRALGALSGPGAGEAGETTETPETTRARPASPGRGTDPETPPEVAARLDAVLAELVAERRPAARTGSTRAGTVDTERAERAERAEDELARRRRRRSVLLAAAASVVVLAGGATVVRGLGVGSGGGSSTSSASAPQKSAPRGDGNADSARGSGTPRPAAGNQPPGASAGVTPPGGTAPGTTPLHTATLARDVRRLLARRPGVLTDAGSAGTCTPPASGRGAHLVAVRLDGRAATLAVSGASAGRRVARVYACRRPAAPVASVTVPAR